MDNSIKELSDGIMELAQEKGMDWRELIKQAIELLGREMDGSCNSIPSDH